MSESLADKIKQLPLNPGVYQFLNSKGEIIYIGKAISIRKRVSSYFNRSRDRSAKHAVLVSKIRDIHYVIVDTESDALILENSLIKKYQPRYNILLKDDKTYPWVCIRNEPFPRVHTTRRVVNDGSKYFGPYPSGVILKTVMDLIRQLYPVRTCSLPLTQDNISRKRFKTCLEFDIGNCKGPCVGMESEAQYDSYIKSIEQILKGDIHRVREVLAKGMKTCSDELRFEQAQFFKTRLELVERFQSKSVVVSPQLRDIDVFTIVNHQNFACVNYLKVVRGAVHQSHGVEIKKGINEEEGDMLASAITEIRDRFSSSSKEILVPFLPEFTIPGCTYTVPQRGDKYKLLTLSLRNCKSFAQSRLLVYDSNTFKNKSLRVIQAIQNDFKTHSSPTHIECFDNSNLQGTNPVSACVVFRNAKPSKREYRHYNIKTVTGANDFASIHEVVYRRYRRLLDEEQPLPQLVVVDGGKGQLSSAYSALKELGIEQKVQIVGIAKRLEEIFFPNDGVPLYLDKTSESLKVIQHLRNEAHRFGLQHHRNMRSKHSFQSELGSIPSIGPKTVEMLFKSFGSIDSITKASVDELSQFIGQAKAKQVAKHFKGS